MTAVTITELSALAGALTAMLGFLAYIARAAFAMLKAIDGHLDAMRENTRELKRQSERLDRHEAIITGTSWHHAATGP